MSRSAISTNAEIEAIFQRRDFIEMYELFLQSNHIFNAQKRREFLEALKSGYEKEFADDLSADLTPDSATILDIAAKCKYAIESIKTFLPHFNLLDTRKIDKELAKKILMLAISSNDEELFDRLRLRTDLFHGLAPLRTSFNITFLKNSEVYLHDAAAAFANPRIIEFLLERSVNVDAKDDSNLSTIDYLAIRLLVEKDEEQKHQIKLLFLKALHKSKEHAAAAKSEEGISNLIKLSVAKFMLHLLYEKKCESQGVSDCKAIAQIIADNLDKIELPDKETFREIIGGILSSEPFKRFGEDRKLQIVTSDGISNQCHHSAYFLVEYGEDEDDKKTPLFVYYIDGNCPIADDRDKKERNFGVARFTVQKDVDYDHMLDLIHAIDEYPQGLYSFLKSSAIFVPRSRQLSVETKMQSRDNCPEKSLMLLCEILGILAYGKDEKAFHEERKEFKHELISLFSQQVKELASLGIKEAQRVWLEVKDNASRKFKEKSPEESAHHLAADILGKRPRKAKAEAVQSSGKDGCVIS